MLYTSYFTKIKEVPYPIAISAGVPKGIINKIRKYEPLIPSWKLIDGYKSGTISEKKYIKIYTEDYLSKLTQEQVISELPEECTLICWEKSSDFCHRHIVADWLREAGYSVEEWGNNS